MNLLIPYHFDSLDNKAYFHTPCIASPCQVDALDSLVSFYAGCYTRRTFRLDQRIYSQSNAFKNTAGYILVEWRADFHAILMFTVKEEDGLIAIQRPCSEDTEGFTIPEHYIGIDCCNGKYGLHCGTWLPIPKL
jgi:hypothetical protein